MGSFNWRQWLKTISPTIKSTSPNKQSRKLIVETLEERLAPAFYFWSGAGGDSNWKTGANWLGGAAPTGSAVTLDDLVFPANALQKTNTNNLPVAVFNSITFSGTDYNLGGNPLTLGTAFVSSSGSIMVNPANPGQNTISLDVQMGAASGNKQFVTIQTGATLTMAGHLSGNTGAELTKTGPGTLVLTNDNSSFSGKISLDSNAGILRITHANALGGTAEGTTVGVNSQLQVQGLALPVNENLILNGSGFANDGALLNVSGANVWAGNIQMDNNSPLVTLGVAAGSLNVSGQISDLGAGQNLTKEGPGQLILSHVGGNTYRGLTTISNGILTIQDPLALGEPRPGGATPSAANGTIVNRTSTTTGALHIEDPSGVGFTVLDELLTLNGSGFQGALYNAAGNNTWATNITLGSPGPNGSSVTIGTAANTTFTISGKIANPNGAFGLNKSGAGKLILNNNNNQFTSGLSISQGIVNIRDSGALGSGSVSVGGGTALELEIDSGFDAHGRNLASDSRTGVFNKLQVNNTISLSGTGIGNTGALRSISGINVYTGNISLGGSAAIGVDPDPTPSNSNLYYTNDYSLSIGSLQNNSAPYNPTTNNYVTTTSNLSGTALVKVGTGHLILPTVNNYSGETRIQQGWITIQNNGSLGPLGSGSDTTQPQIIVSAGAALHLKPFTASDNFNMIKRFVLSGNGIIHPFALINRKGALMSLGGDNLIGGSEFSRSSDIQLDGVAGIGVELLGPNPTSTLTITSSISDFGTSNGGITKLGSQLMILEGDGTYSGANTIREGMVRIHNSTALGTTFTTSASTAPASGLIHAYELNGSYADTYGGPSLVPNGGTLNATNYSFTPGKGLTLSSALPNSANYSIEMTFNIATVSSWRNLIEFKNRQSDKGLYNNNSALQFYNQATGPSGAFTPNVNVTLLLTREAATKEIVGYINGVEQIRFIDSADNGIFSGPGNIIHFFIDDLIVPGEETAGVVDRILIYDRPITPGQSLNPGTTTTKVDRGIAELQSLTMAGVPGTYTLTFNGQTTAPLSTSASAAEVEAALNALSTISGPGGRVTVTQSGNVYMVNFGGEFVGFNQPQLIATPAGGASVTVNTLMNGDGAALELQSSIPWLNGGITAGLGIWNEALILDSPGSTAFDASPLTIRTNDNLWRGPVTLADNTPIQIASSARLTIFGAIDDVLNPLPNGSDLTLIGGGKLALGGSGTYRGNTYINEGTLVMENSQALGAGGVSEVQRIAMSGSPTGTFTLTFNGQTTAPLPGTATAAQVQAALNSLSSIGGVGGSVSVTRGAPEVQAITVTGSAGAFTLTFNGATTAPLPFNATPSQVQGALNGLSSISNVGGSVTVTQSGTVYTVTFGGSLEILSQPLITAAGTGGASVSVVEISDGTLFYDLTYGSNFFGYNQPALTATGAGGTTASVTTITEGTGGTIVADGASLQLQGSLSVNGEPLILHGRGGPDASSEQTVTLLGASTGTFALTFNGQTTAPLPVGSSAAQVQTALNNLSSIADVGGDVSVTGRGIAEVQDVTVTGTSGTFTLTFNGQTTGPLPFNATAAQVETALNNLTSISSVGGSVSVNLGGTPEAQRVTLFGGGGGSSFQLGFKGQFTNPMNTNVTDVQMQTELNALSTISGVGGSVTVTQNGSSYDITFGGSLGTFDQPLLTDMTSGFLNVNESEVTKGTGIYSVTFGGTLGIGQVPSMTAADSGGTSATVTESRPGTIEPFYTINFGGTFSGIPQPLLTGVGAGGTNVLVTTPTNVPVAWFNEGPGPITGWPTPGNQPVTGRVTAVVSDPSDSNVIFAATAAGGVWKTKNGGKTWLPLFDLRNGSDEVQSVTVSGVTGTFALSFNGATTVALPVGATAFQVQEALNDLSTIGGQHGSVTVSKTGNAFTVTFGGNLSSLNLPEMVAVVTGGATATVATVGDGISSTAAMYIGTMVIDPSTGSLYIGTGETNNSTDSFYGTGIYRSDDGGIHWVLVTGTQTQTITVTGSSGTFKVTFLGDTTNSLAYNALASDVKAELDALPSMSGAGSSVNVTRTLVSEVQTVTVAGTAGTVTWTFNGQSTAALPYNDTAINVQNALNALSTISSVGGSVAVTLSGTVYTITFGGSLQGMDVPALVATGAGGATTTVAEQTKGAFRFDITFNGPLASTNLPVMTAVGSGGATASAVTTSMFNPFDGKGISKIIIDTNTPTNDRTLYVASGDGGTGRDEIQEIRPNLLFNGATFTLTFTGADSTGAVVSLTTAPITYDNSNSAARTQTALNIQNALMALANIGTIGGTVTVNPPTGGGGGGGGGGNNNRYTILFGGSLSQTNVQQLTSNYPQPGRGVAPPTVGITTIREGGSGKVVNGTAGNPGVWRLSGGTWFNLTSVVSTFRKSTPSTQTSPAPNPNPPKTPGPDDDYRVSFPQSGVTWSDVALVYTNRDRDANGNGLNSGPVLYIALGASSGNANNGVFWSKNPTTNTPIWYVGAPGGTDATPSTAPTTPDARSAAQFAYGSGNGNIKLAAIAGSTLLNTTVYASTASSSGTLLALYKTTNGGHNWGSVTVPSYLAGQGAYANSILALDANNVYVAGYEASNVSHTQTILRTSDGGSNWTDISIDASGNGPHTAVHGLSRDGSGRLFLATDGGVWRQESNGNWTDLNGNLTVTQINGIASHPTDLGVAFVGVQSNGTAEFSNALTWTSVDGAGGGQVRIDPKNPNNVYHVQLQPGANALIRRSTNGGTSWTTVLTTTRSIAPLVLDNVNTSRLLAGGGGLSESILQGASGTWNNLGSPIAVSALAIPALQGTFTSDSDFPFVTDKGANIYDPDTVYLTDGDRIYVTKNHGTTWVERTNELANLGGIYDIQVDPRNRDTIYLVRNVFGGNRVWMSTDSGKSWTNITSNLPDQPVWKIVIDPRTGDLFVGTDKGVYFLQNGTDNWTHFGAGMPNVQVRDLELNQNTNTLRAGTYGRGVYLLYLDDNAANAGALRAVSGSSVWSGPIHLVGDSLNNSVLISAKGTQALQNGIATASLNIAGAIRDIVPGANAELIKVGQGDVIFSGNNTYGGITEIQEGALVVQNPQALGSSSGKTIVNPGTALELLSDLALETVELNGDGFLFNDHYTGALRNVSNNNTFTGTLSLITDSTIGVDSGSSLTIGEKATLPGTGTIVDGGLDRDLTKELTGTLKLGSANTYGGLTQIHAGVLQVLHSQALGDTGSAFNGTNVFDGSQLQVQTPTTGSAAGQPVIIPGEVLTLSGTGIFGKGALLNTGGNNTWQGSVTLISNPSLKVPSGTPETTPPNHVAFGTTNAGDTLTIDGAIAQSGGSFGVDKVGLGRVTFTKANTYSGVTLVYEGALNIQNGNALGTTSNGTFVFAGAALEVEHATGITVPSEDLTLNGSGLNNTGALRNVGGTNAWNGNVTLQSNTIIGADPGSQLTIQGTVKDPTNPLPVPASTLTKVGEGTLVFPNANPYGGLTFLNQGVLNIRNAGSLGNTGPEVQTITINATGTVGAFTLTFNGQTTAPLAYNVPASGGVGPTGSVQNALNALPSISGVGGSVSVTQTTNVYTVTFGGSLTVLNVPQITAAGFNGVTATTATTRDGPEGTIVASGATLQLQGGINVSTEALTISGSGFGNNGALASVNNNNTWSQPITLAGDSFINVTNAVDKLSINTAINDGGNTFGITKVGVGTLEYGSNLANTYSGLTQVNNGSLQLNKSAGIDAFRGNLIIGDGMGAAATAITRWLASNQLPDNTSVVVNSDGKLDLNGKTEILGPLTVNNGLVTTGTGDGASLTTPSLALNGGTFSLDGPGDAVNVTADVNVMGGAITLTAANASLNVGRDLNVTNGFVQFGGVGDSLQVGRDLTMINSSMKVITGGTGTTVDIVDDLFLTGGSIALEAANSSLNVGDELRMTGGSITLVPATSSMTPGGNVIATSDSNGPASITGNGTLDLGNTTHTITVPTGESLYVDVPLSAAPNDALVKAGSGLLVFDTNASFSNPTTVKAGMFQVDGIAGDILLDGGTLGGNGLVDVVTTTPNGGTASPGESLGIIYTSDVTLDSTNTYFVELQNPVAGTGYDQMVSSGMVSLNNAKLQGVILPNSNIAIDDRFVIIKAADLTGKFQQFNNQDVIFISGLKFNIEYDYTANTVTLVRIRNSATLSLTSSVNPSVYSQDFTITALVTPETGGSALGATDTVTFTLFDSNNPGSPLFTKTVSLSGNLLPSGVAQITIHPQSLLTTALVPSTYEIHADFSGSSDYFPANATPITETVIKANTSATLSSNLTQPVYGQPLILTATISPVAPGGAVAGALAPGGTVTFYLDGAPLAPNQTLDSTGKATITIPTSGVFAPLLPGEHKFTVSYHGDGNYNSSNSSEFSQNVLRASTSTAASAPATSSAFGASVTFTATVSVLSPGSGNPTGQVRFFNGTILLGAGDVNSSGVASFSTSLLEVGAHTINVVYDGDSNFNSSSFSFSHTIDKRYTTIGLTSSTGSNPSVFGQLVTFTATVNTVGGTPALPTGTITFDIDNGAMTRTVTMVSGQALFATTLLGVGTHLVTSTYNGDVHYNSSTNTLNQSVNKGDTTGTIVALPNTILTGQPVTFQVTVAAVSPAAGTPTGSVQLQVGSGAGAVIQSSSLVNGVAQFTVNNLTKGSYPVSATYLGSSNFNTNSFNLSPDFVVHGVSTITTVSTSASSVFYGQSVIFTATVAPTASNPNSPTGAVTFVVGSGVGTQTFNTSLVNGKAQLVVSNLTAGSYPVTATYNGDSNFDASTGTLNPVQTVNKANTTTLLTSSKSAIVSGEPVSFTATVTAVTGTLAGGSVSFYAGSTLLGTMNINPATGVAVLSNLSIAVGSHVITATYSGDSNFNNSTGTLGSNLLVNKANATTAVASSVNPTVYGQPLTFTATISAIAPGAGTPTGTVNFQIGTGVNSRTFNNVALVNGQAQVALSDLAAGSYTVTVNFSGDANFNTSTGTLGVNQVVNQTSTSTELTTTNSNTVYGGTTIKATVTQAAPGTLAPTGTVTFIINNGTIPNIQVNLVNGVATLPNLDVGSYTITAIYNGTANFINSSAGPISQTITQGSTTTALTTTNNGTVFGVPVIKATVAPVSPSTAIPTGSVNFAVTNTVTNNTTNFPVPLVNGVATLPTLDAGTYRITATYSGNTNLAVSSDGPLNQIINKANTATTVASSLTTAFVGQNITFTTTVASVSPATATPIGTVTFQIGTGPGSQTFANVPLVNGQAQQVVSGLPAGTYAVTVTYNGDTNFNSSTSNALNQTVRVQPLLVSSVPTSVVSGRSFTFTIEFRDNTGNIDPTFNFPVTLSIASGPSGGNLGGTLTVAATGGLATFNDLTFNRAGPFILQAKVSGLAATNLLPINVTANRLVPINFPKVTEGINFNLSLNAQDAAGLLDSTLTRSFSVTVISAPSGGSLSGTLNGTISGGIANLSLRASTYGKYFLRIASGDLVTLIDFSVVPTPGRLLPASFFNPPAPVFSYLVTDQFSAGTLAQLSNLRAQYGFYTSGNLYLNYLGLNEKWFLDRSNNWYIITPAGQILRWLGGSSLAPSIATVDPAAWDDPNLILQAKLNLSQADQDQLSQLRANFGFFTSGNLYQNYLGLNEKWFLARNGTDWYVIRTDGRIQRWLGGSSLAAPVATVNALTWDDPNLLLQAKLNLSQADQDQLSQLRATYGFYSSGNLYQNYLGLNEKWFLARNGTDWYVIRTDGRIQRWLGGSSLASPIATVNALAWDDPNLLLQAKLTVSTAAKLQLIELRQTYGFYFSGNYYFDYLHQREKWILDHSGAWYVITTSGQIRRWLGGSSLGAAIATVDPLVWDEPNLLLMA